MNIVKQIIKYPECCLVVFLQIIMFEGVLKGYQRKRISLRKWICIDNSWNKLILSSNKEDACSTLIAAIICSVQRSHNDINKCYFY